MFGLMLARHVLTDPSPTANFTFFLKNCFIIHMYVSV